MPAGETTPERPTDPSMEEAEALLRTFLAGLLELFRLAVLLPLRKVVGWALGVGLGLGLLAPKPREVFEKLESANKAAPVDAARLAAVLQALNRHHPKAVAEVGARSGLPDCPAPPEQHRGRQLSRSVRAFFPP